MKFSFWFHRILLLILSVTLLSCGGGSSTPQNPGQGGTLKSVTSQTTYDQTGLSNLANAQIIFPTNQVNITYGVNTYKIEYETFDSAGNSVIASGLLAVPQKMGGSTTALLSYQHGTITHNSEAPSNNAFYNELAALLASMDYIVVMPDYIGYGTSVAELHTYMHAESLATATIDLLRAARVWLANNNIGINNQLFLAGYSEGGYATIATHKILQKQLASEFTVTASAPGSGAYDISETANTFLNAASLPYAPHVAFVFKAYDEIYGFNRINEIFQATYVDPVNNYFYGNNTTAEVSAAFTNITADLFTATFLNNFRGTGGTEIKNRLIENNVYDWAPQAAVRLFHGQDDTLVPYANSTTAQSTMNNNGASDVLVIDCSEVPANHATCYYPYLDYMARYFSAF